MGVTIRPFQFLLVLVAASLVQACADSPSQPTVVDPGGPRLTCPASISKLSPTGGPIAIVYDLPTVSGGAPPLVGPTCTPASGASFPPGPSTVTCTVTDSKGRNDVCSVAITVTIPPKLSGTRFVAFGDSMTAGDDGTNLTSTGVAGGRRLYPSVLLPVPQRYPSVLQAELASRYTLQSPTVANAGLSGEAVLGTSTFSRFSAVVTTGLYDSVLIMEGANDLADRDATIEPAVIGALAQMIELAKARNIRPILATIPPENQAGSRGLAWSLVAPFDDRIRLLAVAEGIPLADVYQAFNGDLSLIGPDGLHPTAAGYKVIADTFFKAIEQNLETSSTTLRLPARAIVRRR